MRARWHAPDAAIAHVVVAFDAAQPRLTGRQNTAAAAVTVQRLPEMIRLSDEEVPLRTARSAHRWWLCRAARPDLDPKRSHRLRLDRYDEIDFDNLKAQMVKEGLWVL